MLGQLGPVDVGVVVTAVTVAVVVALLVPTLAVVVLSHDVEPLFRVPSACSDAPENGHFPCRIGKSFVPIQSFSATR